MWIQRNYLEENAYKPSHNGTKPRVDMTLLGSDPALDLSVVYQLAHSKYDRH
jgi:hypothetical protein